METKINIVDVAFERQTQPGPKYKDLKIGNVVWLKSRLTMVIKEAKNFPFFQQHQIHVVNLQDGTTELIPVNPDDIIPGGRSSIVANLDIKVTYYSN